MTWSSSFSFRFGWGGLRGSWAALLACVLLLLFACLDRPIGTPKPHTTNTFVGTISQDSIERIDLLFMIDNSRSMSDKQQFLQEAVPDLLERLVNPGCVDAGGNLYPAPAPGEQCENGRRREFTPLEDINIAIVSSSLGDSGAGDSCTGGEAMDQAHLMGSLERGGAMGANSFGFLEWRPGVDANDLVRNFQDLVGAVGEQGCSWEASLESWYRFLVDPWPYQELVRTDCGGGGPTDGCVAPRLNEQGQPLLDEALLAQRAAFLRPDSLLAVVMLSDENDCSIQARGQYWIVADIDAPMFRGSSACEEDPNDPCCYSCPLGPPEGCTADPVCDASATQLQNRLPDAEDGLNLRCFQQKRRFGFDFLYPTERYVNALTQPTLCRTSPDLSVEGCAPQDIADNPIFAGGQRDTSLVYLGGIVGVPWQAVAANTGANEEPLRANELRFKTFAELSEDDWLDLVGEPGISPPRNAHMVESTSSRGIAMGNEVNGREYDTSQGTSTADDLQYACIMPLPEARNCGELNATGTSCDCTDGFFDRPLCERTPGVSAAESIQYWAKAYPGLRQLEVLKGFGEASGNSIVASICARNVLDHSRLDYGYRPAVTALIDRLKEQLNDRCLPRSLQLGRDGTVPCTLVEVRFEGEPGCDPDIARSVPDPEVEANIRRQLVDTLSHRCAADDPECSRAHLCAVDQISNSAERRECQNSLIPLNTEGWCYVADTPDQKVGNPRLVRDCAPTERRMLRFTGAGLADDSVTFVACQGAAFDPGDRR